MSVLNLETALSGVDRVYPSDATINAIQVVLEHPQRMDGWATAKSSAVSVRKAHLNEIASTTTLPVNDTTDLSVEVRRLIVNPLMDWAEGNRRFVAKLVSALKSVSVEAPALPTNIARFTELMGAAASLRSTSNKLYPVVTVGAPGGAFPNYNMDAVVTSKIGYIASGYNDGTGWGSFRAYAPKTGPNGLDNGFNGEVVSPGLYIPSTYVEAYGAAIAALQEVMDDIWVAGNNPYGTFTVTIPSMVGDIAASMYKIYTFLRGEINDYAGLDYSYVPDELYSALAGAFTSL
jgi:hypothetical protein